MQVSKWGNSLAVGDRDGQLIDRRLKVHNPFR
jgi:hypothetical protein